MKIYDHGLEWLVVCERNNSAYICAAFFTKISAEYYIEKCRSLCSHLDGFRYTVVNRSEIEAEKHDEH